MSETLESVIREWVVKDYFTPNIKAEVILDTLLSKYIHELVEGTTLVAKEMSIPRGTSLGASVQKSTTCLRATRFTSLS